jgi:hypothetical protein
MVEDNLPIYTIGQRHNIPFSVMLEMVEDYKLTRVRAEQHTLRVNELNKQTFKEVATKRSPVVTTSKITEDDIFRALSQGKVMPNRKAVNMGSDTTRIARRPYGENEIWKVIEELKRLVNEGKNVEQLLRKYGLPESEINYIMFVLCECSDVDMRELRRHGSVTTDKVETWHIPEEA